MVGLYRAVWFFTSDLWGALGFLFLIIVVVVSVLDRCSAVWRFGAGGLVVVFVVVLVNCFYFRDVLDVKCLSFNIELQHIAMSSIKLI